MKYLTFLLSVLLFLSSCGNSEPSKEEIPTDLTGLKQLLNDKKKAFNTLEQEIADLEAKVNELEPDKEKEHTLVTTNLLPRKTFSHFVDIQATIQCDNTFKSSAEMGGRLIKFDLKEGDMVKKGQFIGEVNMESVDKQVAELEKSLELAVLTFERQERLWKQNIGSEMQYLQAKNAKERIEKTLETIKFEKTKSKIYASASGIVQMTFVKAGDVIAPGTPLIEVLNLSKVKVVAEVPETYLRNVRKGDLVTVKFPALEKELSARVSLLGQTIDPNNRTFKVEVNLDNGNGQLKPNLLATVLIKDFEEKNAVVLPSELIQQDVSGRSFVFVKEQNEAGEPIGKKIFVELGETYNGETMVTSGLQGNEEFIIKGARDLKNGELIKVVTE